MRAAVVPSINGKWEVKEWQTPKAGPNQVVIKIHASGLCYTDVHLTHGLFPLHVPRVQERALLGGLEKAYLFARGPDDVAPGRDAPLRLTVGWR